MINNGISYKKPFFLGLTDTMHLHLREWDFYIGGIESIFDGFYGSEIAFPIVGIKAPIAQREVYGTIG